MARINPSLLKNGEASRVQQQPRRADTAVADSRLGMLTVIKTAVTSAIENVFNRSTMKVELSNGKELQMALQRLETGISEVARLQKSIQVGKGTISSQKIGTTTIANVEQLQLENIEKLSFAFEQLKPILVSLQAGNKLDQQSVALLKNMTAYIQQVNASVKGIKLDFPVTDIVAALHRVEAGLGSIRIEVPEQKEVKFPPFPKSLSMTEGKAILSALQTLAEKIDALPRSYPETVIPKTISVDNFPPQKYPLPPTNINLNPLRGFVKSTAITVGTTATPLPSTALAFRRSIVVYNNDSTNTLYLGGSDVSTAQGTPVPPLSYSPPFDAGVKMIVYGIVAAATINVRVLEASNDTYTRGD